MYQANTREAQVDSVQASTVPTKPVSASAIEEHYYKVFPGDLNASNTVFGGKIMSMLDLVTSIVAERHANQKCVTASVDSIHFLNPAKQGDILVCKASVNKAWRTSMEVGVRVLIKDYVTHVSEHLVSAYFTFVAVDDQRNPVPIPAIIPETKEQQSRYEQAEYRRLIRKEAMKKRQQRER
jgi:acyl-CoA hydrolase